MNSYDGLVFKNLCKDENGVVAPFSVLPPSLHEISLVMKKKNGGLRAKNVSNIQIILAKNEYIVKKSKLCVL